MTLMMISAQVLETSVTTTDNSSFSRLLSHGRSDHTINCYSWVETIIVFSFGVIWLISPMEHFLSSCVGQTYVVSSVFSMRVLSQIIKNHQKNWNFWACRPIRKGMLVPWEFRKPVSISWRDIVGHFMKKRFF